MFEEMRRVGLTDPVYRQTAGSVRLVLADLPRLEPAVATRLPAGSQQVLDTLRAATIPLGTGELAEALDLSRQRSFASCARWKRQAWCAGWAKAKQTRVPYGFSPIATDAGGP
jgi:hypothetical protein